MFILALWKDGCLDKFRINKVLIPFSYWITIKINVQNTSYNTVHLIWAYSEKQQYPILKYLNDYKPLN